VNTPVDAERDMGSVRSALERRYGSSSAFARVVFTEFHDADGNGRTRVPAEINGAAPDSSESKKRSTLAAALVFTAPGIPMIFQGQEMLAHDPFLLAARPLDWSDERTHRGILQLYRDLIHLRRNGSGTTGGLRGENLSVLHVNDVDKVLAFHRWDRGGTGDDVVVVANFANRSYPSYRVGLPAAARGGFGSTATGPATTPGSTAGPASTSSPSRSHGTGSRSRPTWASDPTRRSCCPRIDETGATSPAPGATGPSHPFRTKELDPPQSWRRINGRGPVEPTAQARLETAVTPSSPGERPGFGLGSTRQAAPSHRSINVR
jgi:Alpha amylase, C-terminal all-beta domain